MNEPDPGLLKRIGPTIVYPDGRVCDRLTGAVLWQPGDDPAKHPDRQVTPTPAPPIQSTHDSRFPPLNFDLIHGRYFLTPDRPRQLRFLQDRFLSQLTPLSPGLPIAVQHHERDQWHPWAECRRSGCETWPIWTRSVLQCEVVWETDNVAGDGEDRAASYALNAPPARRIVSAIARAVGKENRRAFAAFQSGQKSVHVVLYLKLPRGITMRKARRLRECAWSYFIRKAELDEAEFDKANVSWDRGTKGWTSRMLHCWGDLAREFPYTWMGFRVFDERRRELRLPPYPVPWDPLTVPEIRAAFESANATDASADETPPVPDGARVDADGDPYLLELASPGAGDHNRALGALAATLKGRNYGVDDAVAWVLAHWHPQGCDDPAHSDPVKVAAHVRRVFASRYVIRPKRWKPPEFVEPTDSAAPILFPGQAKRTSDAECPFGVPIGVNRYKFHKRKGSYHIRPYVPSCNNDLCPDHFNRVAHRAAVAATEDLARLLKAPGLVSYRDRALGEFDRAVADAGRGRRVRPERPVDQYAPAEEWGVRPVRLVIGLPDGTRIRGTNEYVSLREAAEEVARSQGFRICPTFWHYGPGTRDVRDLCTPGWHLETVGAFDGMPPKEDGDAWDEPTSGCSLAYRPIRGPVLRTLRSLRMTAVRVTDDLAEAKLALGLSAAPDTVEGDRQGGERRVSRVRFRVQAETRCHDLCPRPDHHPEPPEPAVWCEFCPPEDPWVDRRDETKCAYIGAEGPPARPISVDSDTFRREWRAVTPVCFRVPGRSATPFDLAVHEETLRGDYGGGPYE